MAVTLPIALKFFKRVLGEVPSPIKALALFSLLTNLALNILAIQGTLSTQMLGMGTILSASFFLFIDPMVLHVKKEAPKTPCEKEMRRWHIIHTMLSIIPLTLVIISSLGITGIIAGDHASLILGLTAFGGSAIYVFGKCFLAKDTPYDGWDRSFKTDLLLNAIYAIGMVALAFSGASPGTVGLGGLIGCAIIPNLNLLHSLYDTMPPEKYPHARPPTAVADAPLHEAS